MTGEVFTNLKCRLRECLMGLAPLEEIFGYMQCLVDLGYLKPIDVRFILDCLASKNRTDRAWIFK